MLKVGCYPTPALPAIRISGAPVPVIQIGNAVTDEGSEYGVVQVFVQIHLFCYCCIILRIGQVVVLDEVHQGAEGMFIAGVHDHAVL